MVSCPGCARNRGAGRSGSVGNRPPRAENRHLGREVARASRADLGVAMGAGRVPGLLLLVALLAMSRARADKCGEREYFHEDRCCVFCEAGTFVADHCSASHLRGKCDPCNEGKDYTAHENGLEGCLPCKQCKEDQVTVRPCTRTQNAECQCKQGYFCADEGCEICQRHSKMHPNRNEIERNCNATTDPECDFSNQGNGVHYWAISVILFVLFAVLGVLIVLKKMKCNKATSTHKDAERGLKSESCIENLILTERSPEDENSAESPESQALTSVSLEVENTSPEENNEASEQSTSPRRGWKRRMTLLLGRVAKSSLPAKPVQNSDFQRNGSSKVPCRTPANRKVREPKRQIIVKNLSQRELRDTFETFIKEVPRKQWKRFMRTHLQENDINNIADKYPNNIEEQSYQMLLLWRNTLGEKKCIINLLDELRCIDTKAYDNVLNTLKSNNIISKVEAAD